MKEKLNECISLLKMMSYWKDMTVFKIRVTSSIKKELVCEPIYNKKILKTKIRSYGDEATDFHRKE